MIQPYAYLLRMIIIVALAGAGVVMLADQLIAIFQANVVINGVIAGIFVIGILNSFLKIPQLQTDINWVVWFQTRLDNNEQGRSPSLHEAPKTRLLRSLSNVFVQQHLAAGRILISTNTVSSTLDGVASRIEENRDLGRYLVGLLVFLGLLGTFWGLLDTITAVSQVINSLEVVEGDIAEAFASLKSGMREPLSGMGTAFSSSLFGLGGSLLLGFLELQAGQAQRRFLNQLEEWLSLIVRINDSPSSASGGGDIAVISPVLEQACTTLHDALVAFDSSKTQNNRLQEATLQMYETLQQIAQNEQKTAVVLDRLLPVLDNIAHSLRTNENIDLHANLLQALVEVNQNLKLLGNKIDDGNAGVQGTLRNLRDIATATKSPKK
ncbi:MAG: MotA/TolQ/ExbB proton channel family protein [Pseudomonadota bacterium]